MLQSVIVSSIILCLIQGHNHQDHSKYHNSNHIHKHISAAHETMQPNTTYIYHWDEIQKHNTKQDLWIVIHGKVLDVSEFQNLHPGGKSIIEEWGGQDATEAFDNVGHSDHAKKWMLNYQIGIVDVGEQKNECKGDLAVFIWSGAGVIALAIIAGLVVYLR